MKDENEQLKWDYFLTNYEKDLLRLPIHKLDKLYPLVGRVQLIADKKEMLIFLGLENSELFWLPESSST